MAYNIPPIKLLGDTSPPSPVVDAYAMIIAEMKIMSFSLPVL